MKIKKAWKSMICGLFAFKSVPICSSMHQLAVHNPVPAEEVKSGIAGMNATL
jgi:hypothetical protein